MVLGDCAVVHHFQLAGAFHNCLANENTQKTALLRSCLYQESGFLVPDSALYARATRCPVLTSAHMLLPERVRALGSERQRGTELRYQPTRVRCYARY